MALGLDGKPIAKGLYPTDCDTWAARVDGSSEESGEYRRSVVRDERTIVVLAVSKLVARESPERILRGFAEFRRRNGNAKLIVVGDGPLKRMVSEVVKGEGMEGDVQCVGHVPYLELHKYYGVADVFLHLAEGESWGLSLGEAMACGVPVVSHTRVGSAVDLIVQNETGALVSRPEAGAVAGALSSVALWRNRELVKGACQDRVRRICGISAACKELERLVEEVITSGDDRRKGRL